MTETTAPPAPADPPSTDPPGTDPPEPADAPADETAGKPGAEAASYRRQLRTAEGERDALATRVERLQRAEVDRLVSDRLAEPGDLTAFGVTIADLLDDNGDVDAELVNTAVVGLLAQRPGLRHVPPTRTGPTTSGLGRRQGAPDTGGPSWSSVIRGR